MDHAGNLVFSDVFNARVRVVAARTGTFYSVPMTAGDIYTVAGDGSAGFTGDGSAGFSGDRARPPVPRSPPPGAVATGGHG